MPLNEKFLKPYNPQEAESRVYKLWEESGFFNPDSLPPVGAEKRGLDAEGRGKKRKNFCIIMPPTNANGSLHAGHALVMTIQDIFTRYKRMRGYKTLWLPGLDHAGFETQVVYEKQLEKEGRSRFEMEPKQLYREILDFTLENSKNIQSQIRSMGASCDWSREKFTLDDDIVKTVYDTFKQLERDNLLYRGKKIVSWCPKHKTSFSDLEIENVERIDPFYYMKYGPFTIGTTRPETKFGDKYVCMNPKDKRYTQYKDGQKIELEWINGPITATVVKDEAIDMAFGTGVMTITPWHDTADFEIAERHGLDKEQVIDENGKLLPIAGEFAGMHITKARPLIVKKLKSKNLLEKIDEKYSHVVRTCYKCGTLIEPQIKNQWFVKMKPLADKALEAIKKGKIVFIPEHYEKIITHWLENIIDWNISRQIVWGIPIPVWYCGNEAVSGKRIGFAGDVVSQVFATKTRTYRLRSHGFDVGDRVIFEDSSTKKVFGYGTITEIATKTVGEIDLRDNKHWKTYEKIDDLILAFKQHHPKKDVTKKTPVWVYTYTFDKVIPKENCGTINISTDKNPKCKTCGSDKLTQDPDTFDTWFSSGQWPFATLGFPDKKDYKTFYPTDLMETAGEIIFFWVARMIMLGLYVTGKVPFKTIYLHGLVLDAKGQKMSKSKGNVINPLTLTEKFGTDALRIGLVTGNTPSTSLALSENKIRGYKNFANKIWNIARFILENTEDVVYERYFEKYTENDIELRKERHDMTVDITKDIEEYRLYMAAEKLYHYVWHTFADKIIEESKLILKNGSEAEKLSRKQFLLHALREILITLHPFMPFVTEEIWQTWHTPRNDNQEMITKKTVLMIEPWPTIRITNRYESTNPERKNDNS